MPFFKNKSHNLRLSFVTKALIVGLLTGGLVSSFRWLAEAMTTFSLALYHAAHQHWWLIGGLIILAVGIAL